MVLVDSSVWIEALRRDGDIYVKLAVENLLEAYEAQYCSPVRLEVLGGARPAERAALGEYFSVIPYRQITNADWERAVSLAWKLQARGLTCPWMDVLIASVALHEGMRVYAVDKHFRAMADILPLSLYRPGYNGSYNPGDEAV